MSWLWGKGNMTDGSKRRAGEHNDAALVARATGWRLNVCSFGGVASNGHDSPCPLQGQQVLSAGPLVVAVRALSVSAVFVFVVGVVVLEPAIAGDKGSR